MSSQSTQYVSVFDGNGWLLWCSQMRAYLMVQGQGAFITPGFSEPSVNAAPAALGADASATEINRFNEANHVRATQIAARNEWRKLSDMTVGNTVLCYACPLLYSKVFALMITLLNSGMLGTRQRCSVT